MSKGDEGGPDSGALKNTPPLYPDHCAAHGNVAVPGNCGDCADVRKANKARPLTLVPSDNKRCIVHDQTFTTVCSGCRADAIAVEETA
jgi:hypothetical protein